MPAPPPPPAPRAADGRERAAPDPYGEAGGAAAPFAPDLHDARHLWLKAALLLAWAAVSFGACYFVRDLTWRVGDWPLGYWIASQGAVLAFIAIVVVYCVAMDRFERADARDAAAAIAGGDEPAAGGSPNSHV
ncbi:DUF4212 domain-containing protein [Acidovorax sp. NCPPB 3859]|nr:MULTISPECIES: sodium/substrate symporter small subunit [unclassified Acidovorax]MDA8451935.1 DUF4212 domain-containing protein [Acidovorax sp. GBBC 3297]MDA8461381.1 DUF4212 domain-containing protein [Acidovorax sp. GBBC 3333]MDA8466414.1 DUF4212 domain-containing protein [Acidovorax sp. GBBC 3332]MDA8471450.1 DUF4212 domain-containing protein [Acidovorax sp. GBBC 3299]WCM80080.1 DUF4212 domain-containing protein [Acidovorax sp. GBBC 712]